MPGVAGPETLRHRTAYGKGLPSLSHSGFFGEAV
jgi:hypothetical protein